MSVTSLKEEVEEKQKMKDEFAESKGTIKELFLSSLLHGFFAVQDHFIVPLHMQGSLRIPRRRTTRASTNTDNGTINNQPKPLTDYFNKKNTVSPEYSLESLVSRKRRRLERQETQTELNELFEKLNAEGMDEDAFDFLPEPEPKEAKQEDMGAEDDDLLASDESDGDDNDAAKLVDMASRFLDEEQSNRLKEVLTDSKGKSELQCNYRFFYRRCRLPDPLLVDDGQLELIDQSARKREQYIYKLSKSSAGRGVLLSTGGLCHWFRRGWRCPNYIYQWLLQIVAFEKDITIAKNAYDTIISLWSNLGDEPSPFQEISSDRRNENRDIAVASFTYVLYGYGAIKGELGWEKLLQTYTTQQDNMTVKVSELMAQPREDNDSPEQLLPLTQFGWIMQLLTYSIRAWPSAYTNDELKYILRLLLQISLDRAGDLVLKEVQDAIESCVYAWKKQTWEEEVRLAASEICMQFPAPQLQMELLKAMKPTCDRCVLLRRLIAFQSLDKAVGKHHMNSCEDTGPLMTTSKNIKMGHDLLARILAIITTPGSVFRSKDADFEELMLVTRLMDAAIGSNENELNREKDMVHQIIVHLQLIGRKIGGRVGVLERTMANETIQRLWNRLAYLVGRDDHAIEEHQSEYREYLYKILVVGDLGTGKTSIIRRYVHNIFSSNYKSTIGVDFALKVIQWSPEIIVRLQLWDIAGQERFGNMTRVYYKEALGAFVVYDVTRPQTFEGVSKWKEDIDTKVSLPGAWGGGRIPVVLLANKSDLIAEGHGQPVNAAEMDRFCKEHGFVKWFETSAKDNTNIDEAARELIVAVLNIEEEHGGAEGTNEEEDPDRVRLDEQRHQAGGGCC
ncbi:rab32, member RAS oncoprotein [Apophysomyces ossiformis]|uniref:Rab32, member RAS oncoprotein n=1 Tax=Apophysomyces ossiformis TaxID=679940 RepID=A0A8H7BGS7_9FUNG|nr:rab32, member RAS oncoprotein [Apophysomyces ossiformis]